MTLDMNFESVNVNDSIIISLYSLTLSGNIQIEYQQKEGSKKRVIQVLLDIMDTASDTFTTGHQLGKATQHRFVTSNNVKYIQHCPSYLRIRFLLGKLRM